MKVVEIAKESGRDWIHLNLFMKFKIKGFDNGM